LSPEPPPPDDARRNPNGQAYQKAGKELDFHAESVFFLAGSSFVLNLTFLRDNRSLMNLD
jgi:hypothetical protein